MFNGSMAAVDPAFAIALDFVAREIIKKLKVRTNGNVEPYHGYTC